ncbi:MAG: SpoIIIAH-like family protein [Clostridiales bacterium]|nr:SpoIIIAH-like family protein [Clostridiales bacterium]
MKLKRPGKIRKDTGVKKVFRRNQIIITTLAIMIAAAGYLNYAGKSELETSTGQAVYEAGQLEISDEDILYENQMAVYDDTIEEAESVAVDEAAPGIGNGDGQQLAEIESWDEGEEAGIDSPGEAVLTSGLTVADYIANVQLNREQIRAKNKETLNNIISSTAVEESAKQEAIQSLIAMTAVAEKENAAETLLQAKGFADPVVSVSEGKVDVVINAASITDQQRAQIEDIVKRKTEIAADGIVITLLNLDD